MPTPRLRIAVLLALTSGVLLALTSSACGGAAPEFATHACGDPAHPVQMPLTCLPPPEVIAGQPDHGGAIARTLAGLAARSTGKPAEMMAALAQEYEHVDHALRADYTTACQRWTTPCDRAQEAAYAAALAGVRARNERLRALHAGVEELSQSGRRVELTDDAAKSLLDQLEAGAEPPAPAPAPAATPAATPATTPATTPAPAPSPSGAP